MHRNGLKPTHLYTHARTNVRACRHHARSNLTTIHACLGAKTGTRTSSHPRTHTDMKPNREACS